MKDSIINRPVLGRKFIQKVAKVMGMENLNLQTTLIVKVYQIQLKLMTSTS